MTARDTIVSLTTPSKLSRTQWRRHYDRWREGGGSRAAYCRQEGLATTRFYYYCRLFSRDDAADTVSREEQPQSAPPAFLPLTLTPASRPVVRIQIADVTIACEGDVSAQQLGAWIQAVRDAS